MSESKAERTNRQQLAMSARGGEPVNSDRETEVQTMPATMTETKPTTSELLRRAADLAKQAAELRAQARADKPKAEKKQGSGTSGGPRRVTEVEAASAAWEEFMGAGLNSDSIVRLAGDLVDAKCWNAKEAETIVMRASGAVQKDVAEALGCNTWMVYNYQRDALQRLAAVADCEWEELMDTLGIKRGHKMPERHTQYYVKAQETEE